MFSWNIVLHGGVCVLPHHVIDGPHDVQHLLDRTRTGQKSENIIEDVELVRKHQFAVVRFIILEV